MEDTLPALLDQAQVNIDLPPDVQRKQSLEEVQDADLTLANNSLKMLYAYLPQVRSITSLCRIISETMNIVEKRRKILCLPYGSESKSAKPQFLEPDD